MTHKVSEIQNPQIGEVTRPIDIETEATKAETLRILREAIDKYMPMQVARVARKAILEILP